MSPRKHFVFEGFLYSMRARVIRAVGANLSSLRSVSLSRYSKPDDPAAMTTSDGSDTFYGGIPVFRGFGSLMDPKLYSPLPDDWSIGIADVVESTKAIAQARYKAVNMAGASVIAAVTNARIRRRWRELCGIA
jgi:Protein of unknown function (DUF3095)